METLVIFIPCVLYNEIPGLLYGVTQQTEERVKSYFILGKYHKYKAPTNTRCKIIGYYCKENLPMKSLSTHKEDWIVIGLKNSEFFLHKLSCNRDNKQCQTVCIIYDQKTFIDSQFLLHDSEFDGLAYKDQFKALAKILNSNDCLYEYKSSLLLRNTFTQMIITVLLFVANCLLRCVDLLNILLKYTTLGLHLQLFLKSVAWVLQSCIGQRKLSVKVGNYIIASIVDICSGILLLYWLMAITSSPSQLLLDTGEVVVRTLRELLQWVMGIPAGLKLNYAFNNMLGRFFLYHINLWWTFLVVSKPLLEITFHIFLYLGRLGLTFQASILADLLALVSFHIYCIYVYAARLYNLQVSGLVALWRLFLGRKYNPLRGRVDSCKYSPDQLFVGTLAFTILLFLLPTTFMYYIVFTSLRLVVVGLGGLLTRVRYVLQCLPLYISALWLLQSTSISSTVHITVRQNEAESPLTLSVKPVASSWWKTVQHCMPEPVQPPPTVEWYNMVKNLISGNLIYPV
ncbi:hypothetical protein L9F63_002850 [Diploptera punctata]|uniref:Phosphatidylinositol N-acetylglucosaminyltransferase subunit Q n=1 Tax=Diploptera punctata TaxID=6984 RepID=A0AAD7ZT23_DIPPU|nr:hypothetical protein L9F63_002850 [Diploptera punctata]